jgi:hypothetical protein
VHENKTNYYSATLENLNHATFGKTLSPAAKIA